MARGDQLGRQWKIIQLLISSRYGKSATEIAGEIDCHKRTVYRDLEALQTAGFPLYNEKSEGRTLWSLLDSDKHQIPVPFSLTELMALYFGRDMLRVFRNTVFYDSLESLFQKIKTTLSPPFVNYLKRIENTLQVDLKPYRRYGEYKEIINTVNQAALDKRVIDMVYFGQTRKKETRRKVAPYKIWFFDGTFYMIGHCMLRNELRTFALERIRKVETTDEIFEVPQDFDFETFMKPSFGVFLGEPETVRIRFSPEIAGHILEKIWHETQKITEEEGGSILFEARVAVTKDLVAWLLRWGSKAYVLEPESLKKEITSEIESMSEMYA